MSVCNNLQQYGDRVFADRTSHSWSRTALHSTPILRRFAATCNVVRRLKNARIGAIGARPAAFNTVRYSEKLLESSGISVETLDLIGAFGLDPQDEGR